MQDNVPFPDREHFLKLARARMPFGKYKGVRLMDLPEPYIIWFSRKGFPRGEIGQMLREIQDIKANGLESLFEPFRKP